jgi:hypothetical protein
VSARTVVQASFVRCLILHFAWYRVVFSYSVGAVW